MRIVSWNDLKNITPQKYSNIVEYKPDILILLEITAEGYHSICNDWKYSHFYNDDMFGDKSPLGIAVFSNNYELGFTESFNRNFRYVVPFSISKDKQFMFNLFVVWTQTKPYHYSKAVLEALKYPEYQNYINQGALFIGDYNTVVKPDRRQDYDKLIEAGFIDCAASDRILMPTYSNSRVPDFFTADLCLATSELKKRFSIALTVPEFDEMPETKNKYRGLSDHCPLIADITPR